MRSVALLFGVLMLPCRAAAQEADPPLEPYSGGPIVVTTVALDPGSAPTSAPSATGPATPESDTAAGAAPGVDATTAASAPPMDPTTAPPVPVPATGTAGPLVTSGSEGEAVRATSTTLAAAPATDPPAARGTALWVVAGVLALGATAAAVGIVRIRRSRSGTVAG